MKIWRRARRAQWCGGVCGHLIAKGDVLLELHIDGLERTLRRCVACAGEEPPAEVPDVPPDLPKLGPLTMHRFSADMLPLDVTAAQAGKD